jgi:peroxiredoxin/protocatechuate 3,4-dioxygenase beta subunit
MLRSIQHDWRLSGAALVGLLVTLASSSLRAGAEEPAGTPRTLIVEARDLATAAPVANVALTLRLPDDVNQQAATGADGVARFAYSLPEAAGRRYFSLMARRDGLVPLFNRWFSAPASPTPPDRLVLLMEKGTTIGGRVLDELGQPLADAVVVVNVSKRYLGSDQRVAVSGESTTTGADGRWSFTNVPDQPDRVEVAAYHYLCLADRSSYFLEPFKPLAALRDGSAVLELQRGTRVDGTVLAPDGQPVAGALVFPGGGRGIANAIPPVKTDADGRFTFGIKPGTIAHLIAQAAGFGPTLEQVRVGDGPQRVYLTLSAAHTVRGRVVDPEGKPVARASVRLFWYGAEKATGNYFGSAIATQSTTDPDGRFQWNEAPASGVHVAVYGEGFAGIESLAVTSDCDQEIVLTPPTRVKATVVDREAGQPIDGFSLTLAAQWKEGNPLIWQRGWNFGEQANRSPGGFETTIPARAHRYLIRVEADGYFAEDSELFAPDGKAHALIYRLTRGAPIRGTIRNPDGSTARDGIVHLVPAHRDGWIEYLTYPDDVRDKDRLRTVHTKIGPGGTFALPPQRDNFALLAMTDAGSLLVPRRDLHGNDALHLQPWSRVHGTVTLDGKPAARLGLQSLESEDSAPVKGEPRLVRQYAVGTDSEGRFELTRVLPGRLTLVQWVPNGVNRRIWGVARATVDVESGRSYDLHIGASGRVATGRLVLPTSDIWMIRKAEIVPRGANAKTDRPVSIGVELLEGGRIRALDLKPDDYALRIALHEPPPADSCGWGRLLGEYRHEFTVPAGTAATDPPLDLGTLEPVAVGGRPLQVGDSAPDFKLKTSAGRELALADFRGKYLLLDFWASWCAPCVAEMPNLQSVQDEFSKDPRFAVIGVSVDERPNDAATMVKAMKLSWLQAFAGPESPVVTAYGATSIPATVLIGPDGKILATELRGEKTRAAVAAALRP